MEKIMSELGGSLVELVTGMAGIEMMLRGLQILSF